MKALPKIVNKIFISGSKLKKFLPFFIGFKLLTFTGFLTYLMNH